MELKGELIDIIYQNELNSYTVGVLVNDNKEETTIVGYLPFINIGDCLKLEGNYITHSDYGEQFKIITFEKCMPETLDSLERYLANGNIKGIGPATAKKIIEAFGEETIYTLKYEPQKLSRIKGITPEKALIIGEEFVENWELWQIVGFLDKFKIGVQNAKSIYKKLGADTISQIEENPYILIDIANNVDFKQIDRMALELGFDLNNEKRVESGIKHAINISGLNGHCRVLRENLISFVKELLKVEESDVDFSLINLKVRNEIIEEGEWIYSKKNYESEIYVANRLKILNESNNIKYIKNINQMIEEMEKEEEIFLSQKQKEAINKINDNNLCIITGGPGTGKTTVIKTIIDIYKRKKMKPVLCAPTGRATKRMTEATGEEAKTLHRLLEIGKVEDMQKQEEIDITPIDADIIIIDEMSMVDLFLMSCIMKGTYIGTKIVFVGDTDQLPSVGAGNVLKDMINSECIPTVVLDEIFRQAAQSKIIVNSHRVNKGEAFTTENKDLVQDFFFVNEKNPEQIVNTILSLCTGRLQSFGNYDFFENIQIITPTKKGMLGTKELNKILQENLNPPQCDEKEKHVGNTIYRIGDRIMQIRNNYDIYWEKKEEKYETGAGVFNGELGTILNILDEEKQVKIKFDDGKIAWYEYSELDQIEHAYAITIHKSQGSEFDVVIMPIMQAAPMLLTRNLLYTGMTRAKKMLIIVGNPDVIRFMIQNINTKKRNTGLEEKIRKVMEGD